MDIINFIMAHWDVVLSVVLQVVGVFALIAPLTPNKTDDKVVQVLLDIVNTLGGNIGKAANAPEIKK